MVRIPKTLLDEATSKAVGGMNYFGSRHRNRWETARKMAGITKGQWKRFQFAIQGAGSPYNTPLKSSETVLKKLEIMRDYHDSPHLYMLLKMAEVRGDTDD